MLRRTMVFALLGSLALAGCSLPTVDKEADAKARALYEQIRTGANLAANADLGPELKTPQALAQLAAVRNALPAGAPTATANRSWNFQSGTGGTTATLIHAYSYPGRTVLAETVLIKRNKVWKVAGFHVRLEGPSDGGRPPVTVTEKPKDA